MIKYVPEYTTFEFNAKQSNTLLIIPVINEGSKILIQLQMIQTLGYSIDIAIADGGSNDASLDDSVMLKSIGVNYLIKKNGPGGLSAQLLTAFDFALEKKYKNIITMDGNLKDDPNGIQGIRARLDCGYDFVQGSRYIAGGQAINTPVIRHLAIKLIHAPLTSLSARYRYTDTTNGFRGFSSKLLSSEEISLFRNVFYSYELLFYLPIRAAQLGMKVCEVPVTRGYPRTRAIPTKIKGFGSHVKLLKILFFATLGCYNRPIKNEKKLEIRD